ncbi:MAG: hypothetical protein OSB38_23350 [Paraburkholderia fungorum]|nr:hypothetical protein [Paraburkholderia fungorum]
MKPHRCRMLALGNAAAWDRGKGLKALHSTKGTGRPCKLTATQGQQEF